MLWVMDVTLDPKDQKDLEALARASGKDPGHLACELLHEALAERKRNGTDSPQRSGKEASPDVSLSGLAGIGKELWDGDDPQEYVKRLRAEWE